MWWLVLALSASAMTLEDAWQAAEGGEEVELVTEDANQAKLTKAHAWASLSPRVSVGANWTLNQREVALDFTESLPPELAPLIPDVEPTIIQKKSYFDANVTVIQPILSVRSLYGLRGATALVRAARATERDRRGELRVGVARAYWGVLLAREGEAIARDGIALAQRHADQARTLVAVGTATRQIELQAQMAVARAERDLAGAIANRQAAERAFATLVERDATGELVEPTTPPLPFDTPEQAEQRSMTRRADLAAADNQAVAARAVANASAMQWVPTVDARFTQLWTQNTSFTGEPWNWMFVVAANWVPFDGGFKAVDNARTASQARQAAASAELLREQASVEVRTAWGERERASAALVAAERELGLAEENLRIAEKSFEAGASTFLDLEDARVARDAARIGVLTERMNAHVATLSLLQLTGDL